MIDNNLLLSSGQTVTATAYSTNNIDTKVYRDMWAGQPLYFRTQWKGTLATATSVDVQIRAGLRPLVLQDGTACTVQNSGNTVTLANHGLAVGSDVSFQNYGGGGLTNGTIYYVTNPTANTFQLSSTEALAIAGTADIDPDADDATVNITQYSITLETTGAVSIGNWNTIKEATICIPQVSGQTAIRTPVLLGEAAGALGKFRYISAYYIVAGSNLAGATATTFLDIQATSRNKYYPSAIVVQ